MYYIGIDGGGTKTTFTLINGQGLKIDQYTAGTTHYAQIGFEGIESVVTEGINLLLSNNKLQRNDIDGLFLGLPGYGEVKSVKIQIEELVAKMFSDIKYAIGNDVEVGLAGSLAGKNGINIVSGTGSI
ncbi:MAG: BadF/BadG/BcrA/BcrD ATPase family protein, partial [Peptostreptococcaceae bacterium]